MISSRGAPLRDRSTSRVGRACPVPSCTDGWATRTTSCARYSPAPLRNRPFEGKWTPNEVIGHLTDSEWTYGYRLRLILSEDEPAIIGTDQDRWVAAQRFNDRDPAELVEMFRSLRELNLVAWKNVTPSEMARKGRHNERGEESLAQMFRMLAGHDLAHIDQINRYLEVILQGA